MRSDEDSERRWLKASVCLADGADTRDLFATVLPHAPETVWYPGATGRREPGQWLSVGNNSSPPRLR